MDQESVISLLLKVGGQDTLEALRKSTANYQALLADLPRQLASGAITADEFTATQTRMGRELERQTRLLDQLERAERDAAAAGDVWERTLRDVDAAAQVATTSTARLSTGAKEAGKSAGGLGRATLETGRAIQDFSQGGIGGVLNNIEGLTASLASAAGLSTAAGAALAGAFTGLGIAASFALPPLLAWVKSVREGSNVVPEAADRLARLNDQFQAGSKRLEELRDKQSLSNAELREYNTLAAVTAAQERDLAAERKHRADLETLKDAKSKEQTGRAGAFREAAAGEGEALQAGLAERMADEERAKRRLREEKIRQAADEQGFRFDARDRVWEWKDPDARRKLGAAEADKRWIQFNEWSQSQGGVTSDQVRKEDFTDDAGHLMTQAAAGEQHSLDRFDQLARRGGNEAVRRVRDRYRKTNPAAVAQTDADFEGWKEYYEGLEADQKALGLDAESLREAARKRKTALEKTRAETARLAKTNRAERDQRRDEERKGFEGIVDEEARKLGGGGLDDAAAAAAARYRFDGGYQDRRGRLVRLDPEQQRQALEQDLSGIVGRTNPEMAITTRDAVAAKMAADAMARADAEAAGRRPFAPDERSAQYAAMASLQTEADRAAMDRAKGWAAGGGPGMSGMPGMAPTPSTAPTPTRAQAGAAMAADQAQAVMDAFDAYGQAAAASQDAGSSATAATQAAMAKALDALQGALGRIERLEDQARQLDQMADGLTARARSPQRRGR